MELEWDERKAVANLRKHGVDFADAATVLHDDQAITVPDERSDEQRFVTIGDATRKTPVRGNEMKKQYDFSHGRRGAVLSAPPGKTRITIRIDDDILQWFRAQVHKAGGGSYQTVMNEALRSFLESSEGHLEETLRRVLREEFSRYRVRQKAGLTRR